jgi:hypothetical protein
VGQQQDQARVEGGTDSQAPGGAGEPLTYQIGTVNDFLAVPEDRIGECLEEFAHAIDLHRRTAALISIVAEAQGNSLPVSLFAMPSFTWIDDGLKNVTVLVRDNIQEKA